MREKKKQQQRGKSASQTNQDMSLTVCDTRIWDERDCDQDKRRIRAPAVTGLTRTIDWPGDWSRLRGAEACLRHAASLACCRFRLPRVEALIGNGNEVFARYLAHTMNGKSFRIVEYFRLKDGKVEALECYFGGHSTFPSAVSKS